MAQKRLRSFFFILALVICCTLTLSAFAAVEEGGTQVSQSQAEPKAAIQEGTPAKVNINLAGAADLEKLKGIGPKIAEEIVSYREANGPFGNIEDLMKVKGVGQKKYETIKDLVSTE